MFLNDLTLSFSGCNFLKSTLFSKVSKEASDGTFDSIIHLESKESSGPSNYIGEAVVPMLLSATSFNFSWPISS